ncbi:putative membrane protein YkgB [Pedobacter sp. UYP24]
MKSTTLNEQTVAGSRLENFGAGMIRYGLAIVLIWIGILKFTTYEAEGIKLSNTVVIGPVITAIPGQLKRESLGQED